jgi:hypothetical protein
VTIGEIEGNARPIVHSRAFIARVNSMSIMPCCWAGLN